MSDANAQILKSFEEEIARQEELLYGIALFFEGISLLFAGQDAVLETYRKQFRNIIQIGNGTLQHAREVFAAAQRDPQKISLLELFAFRPGEGHPEPEVLAERARILARTYADLFPGRPREQAMTEDETLKLMEAASLRSC